MCRCLVQQCPYNSKGFCSSRMTVIAENGLCAHLNGNQRWQEPVQYKQEVNVITLAKREEKEDVKEIQQHDGEGIS